MAVHFQIFSIGCCQRMTLPTICSLRITTFCLSVTLLHWRDIMWWVNCVLWLRYRRYCALFRVRYGTALKLPKQSQVKLFTHFVALSRWGSFINSEKIVWVCLQFALVHCLRWLFAFLILPYKCFVTLFLIFCSIYLTGLLFNLFFHIHSISNSYKIYIVHLWLKNGHWTEIVSSFFLLHNYQAVLKKP